MKPTASLTGSHLRISTNFLPMPKLPECGAATWWNAESDTDFLVHGHVVDHTPHLLVVIEQHGTRLFHTVLKDGLAVRLLPHEPLTKALQDIARILVCGIGTRMGHVMDQFVGWAKAHNPQLSRRIIGTVIVDNDHPTDDQILAMARICYVKIKRNEI